MFNNLQQKDVFWLAPVAALVIVILPMPIGYYTLLRIIVCAGSAYFAYQFYKKKKFPKLGYLVFLQFYTILSSRFTFMKKLFGLS